MQKHVSLRGGHMAVVMIWIETLAAFGTYALYLKEIIFYSYKGEFLTNNSQYVNPTCIIVCYFQTHTCTQCTCTFIKKLHFCICLKLLLLMVVKYISHAGMKVIFAIKTNAGYKCRLYLHHSSLILLTQQNS
jgi:hypothetical protein